MKWAHQSGVGAYRRFRITRRLVQQDRERRTDVLGPMAAIIDDHLEPVGVISDPAQQIRIGLAPMVGPNPVPIDERLVLDIQAQDLRAREEHLPHP